ncbi:MAG: hypothetical protein V3W19_15790 [Desulfatiglandales bacterium]
MVDHQKVPDSNRSLNSGKVKLSEIFIKVIALALLLSSAQQPPVASSDQSGQYKAVTGLFDLRSTFSDGDHSIEEMVKMASSRGFKVLFINDHDRIALSYGILPFRNILRYKKEFPSMMTHGPEKFLEEIDRISKKYSDMIIIPGCITSAHYYWTGSWLKKNLTVHGYDRRIIIINFDDADDYNLIPSLHNKLSRKYTKELLPGLVVFIVPLFIGLILVTWKGFSRFIGVIIVVLSILAIIDYNPFRSSMFSSYRGDQGIAPFQELINYVNQRGGLSFWNYPEQRSGVRKYGPINVSTLPYPQVLHQSKNYTGFAAIYGDNIKATNPGKEWDKALIEYCRGKRERPPWGISTADFHEDGRLGLKLGAFPTTFLVETFSRKGVIEAIERGRMYASRGNGRVWPRLDYFNVLGKGGKKAFMGETLTTSQLPVIKFRISYNAEQSNPMKVLLIRGGQLIHTFKSETPIEVDYVDKGATPGEKTYYRLMDSKKHLTSNPIFVTYKPTKP